MSSTQMENDINGKEGEGAAPLVVENSEVQDTGGGTESSKRSNLVPWIVTAVIVGFISLIGIAWIVTRSGTVNVESDAVKKDSEAGHSENELGEEVRLDAEAIKAAELQIEGVTQRPAVAKLYVTGSVELNPERTEMATPLVSGRIQIVRFSVGDYVNRGDVLAWISSPQIAQLHGKRHEALTAYELANRNLDRVQRSENRVAVLEAKAKLDEAEATLRRTRRLIELGAGAGKDLISAETSYRTAKADFEFQSNISLNKEIQEAKAAVETTRVDLAHIVDEMRSLGVLVELDEKDDHSKDTSLVAVRAPLSGVITERRFNAGAGIDAGNSVFSISNLGTVYVIASVPQVNVNRLVIGTIAEVRMPAVGTTTGRISFIDPRIDEQTRTARVRLEVPNPGGKLRGGMFAEVGFTTGTSANGGQELVIRTEAIQREGDKTIVFVPKDDEPGAFEVREIEIGGEFEGYTSVKRGLDLGEKVVTTGSFILKAQRQKGEMGDHH